jgi:putative transposase
MLTFKRKLILNKAQSRRIDEWVGVCRFVYNMCIEIKKESYKNKGISVSRFDLSKQLSEIRNIDWVADVPRQVLENAIKRMDLAYGQFFKTYKIGGGFPKFAIKGRYSSIQFYQNVWVGENYIRIPKIGQLKMFKDSPISGVIKIATIKKELGDYYVCVTTDAVKSINSQDKSQVLGLDMGIARLLTDSNGQYVDNPRHYQKYERKLRIENRTLSRKRQFGKNWIKQKRKIAAIHSKIADVRADFLHKESTRIAKHYNTVVIEDLNISGMQRSRLGKNITDVGWGMFRKMLEYKTNVIAVNPKFTSQTCNDCGAVDRKSRISQSDFICTACGTKSHADENAAKNILGQGMAVIRQREAQACA